MTNFNTLPQKIYVNSEVLLSAYLLEEKVLLPLSKACCLLCSLKTKCCNFSKICGNICQKVIYLKPLLLQLQLFLFSLLFNFFLDTFFNTIDLFRENWLQSFTKTNFCGNTLQASSFSQKRLAKINCFPNFESLFIVLYSRSNICCEQNR